jgi:thioredoxin 1
MTGGRRLAIAGVLLAVFAAAIALKEMRRDYEDKGAPAAHQLAGRDATTQRRLPRLVDLGSDKCIPCKMMAPILEELKTEYDGRMAVEVIDVRKNRAAGAEYGITVIPTQIFLGPSGEELFRHEGYISKSDILAKWKELGVDLEPSASTGRRS